MNTQNAKATKKEDATSIKNSKKTASSKNTSKAVGKTSVKKSPSKS